MSMTQKKEDIEKLKEDWPLHYYEIDDAMLRKKLLEEMPQNDETKELLRIWNIRFKEGKNDEAAEIRNNVQSAVMEHEWALQLHGFYADTESKFIRFDVVASFDVDPNECLAVLKEEIGKMYPEYTINITHDIDISD